MIEVKCNKCRKTLATRDGNTITLGGVVVVAPCDLMCAKCGTVNNLPVVPTLPKDKK